MKRKEDTTGAPAGGTPTTSGQAESGAAKRGKEVEEEGGGQLFSGAAKRGKGVEEEEEGGGGGQFFSGAAFFLHSAALREQKETKEMFWICIQ